MPERVWRGGSRDAHHSQVFQGWDQLALLLPNPAGCRAGHTARLPPFFPFCVTVAYSHPDTTLLGLLTSPFSSSTHSLGQGLLDSRGPGGCRHCQDRAWGPWQVPPWTVQNETRRGWRDAALGTKGPSVTALSLPTHLNCHPRLCFQPGLPLGVGGHYLLSEVTLPVSLQGPSTLLCHHGSAHLSSIPNLSVTLFSALLYL